MAKSGAGERGGAAVVTSGTTARTAGRTLFLMVYALAVAAAAAIAAGAGAAQDAGARSEASDFPSRPIRLLIGFTPGGASDVVARILAKKLAEVWTQQVVVDNRPGAGGVVAFDIAAKANPDGHTLIFASSSFVIQPSVTRRLPYDSLRDFAPVTLTASGPYLLVVHPAVKARSVEELIELAKAQPGKLSCASAGVGSALHLAAELFNSMAGVNIINVPYKGAVGVTDLIGGQVQMAFAGLPQSLPHVRSGRLRALGVTTPARSAVLPDVPTLAEAGVPGYDVTVWYGMIAPAATPRPVITKLHNEVVRALGAADVRQLLVDLGLEPVGNTPEQFAAIIRREIQQYAQAVKRAGIQPE